MVANPPGDLWFRDLMFLEELLYRALKSIHMYGYIRRDRVAVTAAADVSEAAAVSPSHLFVGMETQRASKDAVG
jgi:hypothetical protein